LREYTPELESFREDALAVLNGAAVTMAVAGFWWKPVFSGPVALVVALLAYAMSPRSKGGTIVAVLVVTLVALLTRWLFSYSVV
jgi:apolipoprotein N-acyltransferase